MSCVGKDRPVLERRAQTLAKKTERKKKRAGPKPAAAKAKGAKKRTSPVKAQRIKRSSAKLSSVKAKKAKSREPRKPKADKPRAVDRLPMAAPSMSVGLLGGSFNPAHQAHREISLTALKRLGLDQVWWLVSPVNPLKDVAKLPSLESRVEAAKKVANSPRIEVTGFSGGSPYTIDLIAALKRRFPGVNFVWLMGADNLAQFHRWRAWDKIFGQLPIGVLDRPGFRLQARAGMAAQRFATYRVDESDGLGLARLAVPAWTIVTHRLSGVSSTALRAKKARQKKARGKDKKSPKKRSRH
jgi:nicotinate-nucleotide adenylyltransferase